MKSFELGDIINYFGYASKKGYDRVSVYDIKHQSSTPHYFDNYGFVTDIFRIEDEVFKNFLIETYEEPERSYN